MQTTTGKPDSQPTERPRQTRLEAETDSDGARQAKDQPAMENADSQAPMPNANPTEKPDAETEGKAIPQQPKKPARAAKAKNPRKPKPARKRPLSKFDSDFFKLVRRGEWSVRKICDILGVAPAIARERMLALEKRGLVAFDKLDPDAVRLTIRGYNAFDPRDLTLSLERKMIKKAAGAGTGPIAMAAAGRENNETASGTTPANQVAPTPAAITTRPTQSETPKPPDPLPPHAAMDLGEMIARGAPRKNWNEQPAQDRRDGKHGRNGELPSAQAPTQPPSPQRQAAQTPKLPPTGEKCELCKAAFTLHVSGGNPKYGHCFCGAAYHRDCYDEMNGNKRGCIRCGRGLEIILDRQSRESMRGIKNAFE